MIQLMVADTVYLPATIIRPRPTREQFERDFVNSKIPADDLEIARKNTDEAKRRLLARTLPRMAGKPQVIIYVRTPPNIHYQGPDTSTEYLKSICLG